MSSTRLIALIALCATLFSGASPTLAAILFSGNATVLGQVLGIPKADAPAQHPQESSAHHADHSGGGGAEASDQEHSGDHYAHGIYCSFCLSQSSTAALPCGGVSASVLDLGYDRVVAEATTQHSGLFVPQYRSRAPPTLP